MPTVRRRLADPRYRAGAAALAIAVVIGAGVVASDGDETAAPAVAAPGAEAPSGTGDPQIVVGEVLPENPADQGPGVEVADDGVTLRPRPEPAASSKLLPPDGSPPGPPLAFDSDHPGARDLVFAVVAGSDARPGEDVIRTRADSVHVVALDPATGRGTIVGIPRDAYVDVPGHGKQKINSALSRGGPELLARTVAELTGMPIRWYAVVGFAGFDRLVDDLGGVAVHVDRRMDDKASGARFDRGWHRFHGLEALAFSRNRKDTEFGDFSRSGNQGVVMLATLTKMRAEIGDDGGLTRWLDALRRHVRLDAGLDDLFSLAVSARRTDPRQVANVVASGTVGRAGGQSVVFLDDAARAMFADVADDGVLRNPPPPYDPPGSMWTAPTTTTTTTTAVAGPPPPTTGPGLVPGSSTTTTTTPSGSSTTTTLLPVN